MPVDCPSGPGVVERWWGPLLAALEGGPALVPVPDGPARAGVVAIARLDEPVDEGVALVVPTSGSTGAPKGAVLTSDALRHSAVATLERLGGPGRWVLALPVTHIAGLQVLVRSALAGEPPECVELAGGFRPDVFAAAADRLGSGRRYTALVPTQLSRLLDAGGAPLDALARFDAVLVGGAATPAALAGRARRAGVRIVSTYGMSETAGGCVYDGEPLRGVLARAGGDGRLRLGGPTVFSGYRCRPELTAASLVCEGGVRWHVTGDVGSVEDGRVRVLGRADDVIVTGGEKVAPALVEEAVASVAGVLEAAVVGVPHPEWGEEVVAVVVAAPGAAPSVGQVREALRDRLPAHCLPRRVVTAPALPLIGTGKVDRGALRRSLSGPGA